MISKITTKDIEIVNLLSLATASNKAEAVLDEYIKSPDKDLYAKYCGNVIEGCIGIDIPEEEFVTITHIAVKKSHRKQGKASEMINFVRKVYKPSIIMAETDHEAVKFYENYGFEITSLGEKYPHVERFKCILRINHILKKDQ